MSTDEERKLALEHRFALEVELGYAADALRTYERRADLERPSPRDPPTRQAAALTQARAAANVAQAAHLGGSGQWEHLFAWKTFELSDANGAAEGLGVECHRNKAELLFRPNAQMTIPPSLGACVLTIHGEPETTLTLHEFP